MAVYEPILPRRIASLDGGEISEGKRYFDLPKWFTREGRKFFTIDTGFGMVRVKAIPVEEENLFRFSKADPKACKELLPAIVQIPAWVAEDDITLDRDLKLAVGDPIPQPFDLSQRNPQVCAKYVSECLPMSLVTQIVAGFRFMMLPPIAYTEVDPD